MMIQGIGMREVCEQNKKQETKAKRPVKTNLASAGKWNVCEYDAKMPRRWNRSKLKDNLSRGARG